MLPGHSPEVKRQGHAERRFMRLLVRSLGCCVLASAAWAQAQVVIVYPPPPPPPPSVVIVRAPAPRPIERQAMLPIQTASYLIAFKDGRVLSVAQYWVKDGTLNYMTEDHLQGSAPVAQVDRAISEQLNNERNVAFDLPPQSMTVVTAKHVVVAKPLVRHTAAVVHKKCYCVRTVSAVSSPGKGTASRRR